MNKKTKSLSLLLPINIRLDIFLNQQLENYSRSFIQKLIKKHQVSVGDKTLNKPSFTAKVEIEIKILLPITESKILQKTQSRVEVIFENTEFAIINKPAGITVHPGAGTKDDTLAHILNSQFSKLSQHDELWDRPGIVHRLDRDTSGLMIIAKTNQAYNSFSKLFQERKISKIYRCWLWSQKAIKVESYNGFISRDLSNRKLMKFSRKEKFEGERSSQLEVLEVETKECFSYARIQLHTGRTHQIRATFNAFNAPVINDKLYGNHKTLAKLNKFSLKRLDNIKKSGLMLQASELGFNYSIKGQEESFYFKLEKPQCFREFEDQIKDRVPQNI